MAIDTDVEIEATFFRRWISVGEMKELLAHPAIQDNDTLHPNRVGNLSIVRDGSIPVGFIDVANAEIEIAPIYVSFNI